jgi:TolB-like protein/DNA-binding winged helix-turn-helix (wHTH) protein/Tfp pilus assembly protein PilF
MESLSSPRVVRFGLFEADLLTRELRKQGKQVRLQEQPFQVLACLLEKPGEMVTREELRQKLWPTDTFVDYDNSVNAAVNRLREALGDSAENPRFIETLTRRGYRFIAPVASGATDRPKATSSVEPGGAVDGAQTDSSTRERTFVEAAREPRSRVVHPGVPLQRRSSINLAVVLPILIGAIAIAWFVSHRTWPLSGHGEQVQIRSLAVLPLDNLSGDKDQEYFADGMTDALITDLGKVGAVRVISRTSVMHYKGTKKTLPVIAGELNVDAILEGAVLRSGDRVRITAQLIQATNDRHLWAESYERDLRDVLLLQSEVARDIADQIHLKLAHQDQKHLASVRLVNPEAHDEYLRGLYYFEKWTPAGTKVARDYFQKAIQKDSNYALAYAGLAATFVFGSDLPLREAAPQAREAATKALELDESLGEAHASLGQIRFSVDWDRVGAEKEFRRAIELNPNYAEAHHMYSHFLLALGRSQESLAESRRFLELDPVSPAANLHLGSHYLIARQYDQAITQELKTLQMDPNYAEAHRQLGDAYWHKAMYGEAVNEYEKELGLLGRKPADIANLRTAYLKSGWTGYLKADIKRNLQEFEQGQASPVDVAGDYALLGEPDQAFRWLEKGYQTRYEYLIYLKAEPAFDGLHSDHRYADLLRRIGLPP